MLSGLQTAHDYTCMRLIIRVSFAGLLLSSLSRPPGQRRRPPAHWCQLSSSQCCHLAPCQRTAWCSSSRRPCHCPSSRPWCAPCVTMHCLFACLAHHLAEKGSPLCPPVSSLSSMIMALRQVYEFQSAPALKGFTALHRTPLEWPRSALSS